MSQTNNDDFYVLSFINENGITQYIKSYVYKKRNVNRCVSGQNWYKTYIYLTPRLAQAKMWKKKNGAFRIGKNIIAPTLNIDPNSIFIEDVSIQRIRREKILELGLLN
jgi:hypothetical protein